MGTEVLRPQDCLIQRIRVAPAVFHRRKNYTGNGNPNPPFRKTTVRPARSEQKKRPSEPSISKRSASAEDLRPKCHHNHLVSGQVTILRRGESPDSRIKGDQEALNNGENLMVSGTGRVEMVPKQIRISSVTAGGLPDVYAGSAFSMSPSPRSLPYPSFFNKKNCSKTVDDSATRDLRRLLRLD